MDDRFNTPHTSAIEIELLGHNLLISQDPNSKHLGTTVWDSSLVFAKFLERNSKKGEFSRAKLNGKRAIELGAGCGLAGLAMALLGCDVVVTDQVTVLPLLIRNVERNLSRAKYAASDQSYLGPIGNVEVSELDWGNEVHVTAVQPPFDYIIGTDVVYAEHLLEPLITTMLSLAGPKSTVLLGYEFRSSGVREKLQELCQKHFLVKKVLHGKMDPKYQHPNIDLFILRRLDVSVNDRPSDVQCQTGDVGAQQIEHCTEVITEALNPNCCEDTQSSSSQGQEGFSLTGIDDKESEESEEELRDAKRSSLESNNGSWKSTKVLDNSESKDTEWEVRRLGSAAARLLSNVTI